MAIDNVKIARWLESLHVVRISKLERQEAGPQFTTLHFMDVDGMAHTVSVNPDGSPREYKDPKGHVHQYNTKYKAPAQTAKPVTTLQDAGPTVPPQKPDSTTTGKEATEQDQGAGPTVVKGGRLGTLRQLGQGAARPQTGGTARVAGGVPPQPPKTPSEEARARPSAVTTPAQPRAVGPSAVVEEHPEKQEKKSLEEIVVEWAAKNQSLSGISVLRREITSKGITFRLKGPDGAEYEAVTGMDQQVKSFRKL